MNIISQQEESLDKLFNKTQITKINAFRTTINNMPRNVLLRLIMPLAKVFLSGMRNMKTVNYQKILRLFTFSQRNLINLLALIVNTIAMNLSSQQVSERIGPIFRLLKIHKSLNGIKNLAHLCYLNSIRLKKLKSRIKLRNISDKESFAMKCCHLEILAEPPPGQLIRADIIFFHGLHGSIANTWKQGVWRNDRKPVEFKRPPTPIVRPPKRTVSSRSTTLRPPHKRKRLCNSTSKQRLDHTYVDSSDDTDESTAYNNYGRCICQCDSKKYTCPTFRWRTNHNSRLVKMESEMECTELVKKSLDNQQEVSSTTADNYSKCWPGDWLPLDCPGVRVLAINYSTDQYLWRPVWKEREPRTNLIQRAREMMELLVKYRVGCGHPIIYVGHSKGGLFAKQIIVAAWESGNPQLAPLWHSARGVFFYSVPHRGSHLASIRLPFLARSVELLDIEKSGLNKVNYNKYLLDLHRRFVGLFHLGHLQIEVFSFVETALTFMSVLYLCIVGVDSADPGIGDVCGIRLDHREICKPRNRNCILYTEIVKMIKRVT